MTPADIGIAAAILDDEVRKVVSKIGYSTHWKHAAYPVELAVARLRRALAVSDTSGRTSKEMAEQAARLKYDPINGG